MQDIFTVNSEKIVPFRGVHNILYIQNMKQIMNYMFTNTSPV